MDQYEKNVDAAANKVFNTAEKVGRGANKLAIGCTTALPYFLLSIPYSL